MLTFYNKYLLFFNNYIILLKIDLDMTKRDDFIWNAIQTATWFIFAGFCVQTGALLFNYIYSLYKPVATYNLYLGLNLSALYTRSIALYSFLFAILIGLSFFKAFVFYTVIKIFKKLNFIKPFSKDVHRFIAKTAYYTFSIGIVSLVANKIVEQLITKGFDVGGILGHWNDYVAFLMMAAILFVISLIFQTGIELQNENDLTV